MHGFIEAIAEYDYLAGFLSWMIKSALLLAIALLLCRLLRRYSPAIRNMILRASIFGVLILALAIPLLPVWQIPSAGILPVTLPHISATFPGVQSAGGGGAIWPWIGFAVWALGALFFAIRYVLGLAMTASLVRTAKEVSDPRFVAVAHGIETELGITEPVHYLRSARISLPITWGIFSPVVIVPTHPPLSEYESNMVLRHELAHVRRRDVPWLNISTLLTIIQWFNPLVWIVRRNLQIESESACDNYVLTGEISPDTYAHHVLQSARTALTAGRLVMTCMAYNSNLEGRIMSILNSHRRDFITKRSTTVAVIAALLAGCLTLAGLTLDSCNTTDQTNSASAISGAQNTAPLPDTSVAVNEMPEMIYQEVPVYPKSLKEAGTEGDVWVKAFVNKEGTVTEAVAAKSSGHKQLDDAAVDAAVKNKFKPAIKDGKPVGCWVTYKVAFRLSDEKKEAKE